MFPDPTFRAEETYETFCARNCLLLPARAVLSRAREIFPDLALTECLEGCRHIPSKTALGRANEGILAFLAGPDETYGGR